MQTKPGGAISLQEITTLMAYKLPLKSKIVIFPIGSNEQHGPHLPIGTDTYILDAVIGGTRERLSSDDLFVFLPSLPYGKSPEHLDFTGTVSFRATTLIMVLEDVVSSLQAHGVTKMVILNSHGGNTSLINSIAFDLHHSFKVDIFCLNLWSSDFMDSAEIQELVPNIMYPDVHAASIETSLLLYLHPELVGNIPWNFLPSVAFPEISTGWATKELSNTGVIGDLRDSKAEIGEKLYKLLVEKAVQKLNIIAHL